MTCLHVSWHFIHVQLLFYAFFIFMNAMNMIIYSNTNVQSEENVFSNMASEIHLRWFFFIKVEMMLLGAPSGTQNLPVFSSLLGPLLTCITESAFLKIQYFKMLSPYCIFFMVFSSSVPLLLPSVSLCDVLTGVC